MVMATRSRFLSVYIRGVLGMGNVYGANLHGLHGVDIAQFESNHISAHGYLHHLSYGAIGHIVVIGHKAFYHSLWGCSPSTYPSLCCRLHCDGAA